MTKKEAIIPLLGILTLELTRQMKTQKTKLKHHRRKPICCWRIWPNLALPNCEMSFAGSNRIALGEPPTRGCMLRILNPPWRHSSGCLSSSGFGSKGNRNDSMGVEPVLLLIGNLHHDNPRSGGREAKLRNDSQTSGNCSVKGEIWPAQAALSRDINCRTNDRRRAFGQQIARKRNGRKFLKVDDMASGSWTARWQGNVAVRPEMYLLFLLTGKIGG
ncbi:hypothetical protein R1flu_026305 [Riccia fluitans]|uniref:Uncharacterized protein n=1 Tax=Riccia fluitans TaxID=41844 RepID=A0ABD1XFL0_9MARC